MVGRASSSLSRRPEFAGRLLGLFAVVTGVGGAAYSMGKGYGSSTQPKEVRAYVPEFNVVEIPVPNAPVPAGALLREISIRYEKYPEHQLPTGVVREIGTVRDAVTLVGLPGGLPILRDNVGSPDEASHPLVGRIPSGMRAMTVRVDAMAAVEGWARSGTVVDVLLVEKNRTTVVAEQVKIISADRSLSGGGQSGTPSIPSTVTLLVTQEQCLAVNTAVALGKIAFALRSGSDADSWRSTQFAAKDFTQGGTKRDDPKIEGAVSVGIGSQKRNYALVNGRWVPSESTPTGFFVSRKTPQGGER